MNTYIELNGKKYTTLFKNWNPVINKPSTDRLTSLGAVDVTYGPAVTDEWIGTIEAPVAAEAGWGTIDDLRTAFRTLGTVSFVDHMGNASQVHILGTMQQRSLTPKWDGPSNMWYADVRLVIA